MINRAIAFIIYQPGPPGTVARVNINSLAETILAFAKDPTGKTIPSRESATALCSKWASLLGKRTKTLAWPEEKEGGVHPPLDIFLSHRRKYEVRGVALDGRLVGAVSRYPSYAFVLERADSSQGRLQMIFRKNKLSPREQDLVRYLFSDLSNKEIGRAMGLSSNTVKGYLKSLALKMGRHSRIGILAALYFQTKDERDPSNKI